MKNLTEIISTIFAVSAIAGSAVIGTYQHNKKVEENNYKLRFGGTCSTYIGDKNGDGNADTAWFHCIGRVPVNIEREPTLEEFKWYQTARVK